MARGRRYELGHFGHAVARGRKIVTDPECGDQIVVIISGEVDVIINDSKKKVLGKGK